MNILIMGRPGSGKSTIAALLQGMLGPPWHVFSDYPLLCWMYEHDRAGRFTPTPADFAVRDEAVYSECLTLCRAVLAQGSHALFTFARRDYDASLALLGASLLSTSHCLFVDAPLALCAARITARADHHVLPPDILIGYYRVQTPPATVACTVIDNSGEREALLAQVAAFAEGVRVRG